MGTKEISRLTKGQKEALRESLENQVSIMTEAEKETMKILQEDSIIEEVTIKGYKAQRLGDKVRLSNLDTFGEDYRNCWLKVKTTAKGEYFISAYLGGERNYLDNDNYIG